MGGEKLDIQTRDGISKYNLSTLRSRPFLKHRWNRGGNKTDPDTSFKSIIGRVRAAHAVPRSLGSHTWTFWMDRGWWVMRFFHSTRPNPRTLLSRPTIWGVISWTTWVTQVGGAAAWGVHPSPLALPIASRFHVHTKRDDQSI